MSPYVRVSRTSHEPLIHLSNNKTPRVLPISATLFISSSLVSNERSILPSSRTRAIFQPSRHLGGDREESQSEGEEGRGCIQCFSFTLFFLFLFFAARKTGDSFIFDPRHRGGIRDVRFSFQFPARGDAPPLFPHATTRQRRRPSSFQSNFPFLSILSIVH